MSRVAVLIVIYNAPDYVEKALASVRDQSYRDLEVWLLDDGSTDPGIEPICLEALEQNWRYHNFHTTDNDRRQRVTYASNINWGVEQTDAEYITFLAGDDTYYPDRIERMMAKIAEGPHDIVYGSQDRPNANGRFVAPLAVNVLTDAFNQVDMSSVLMTKEAFVKAGGFPTDYDSWGDADGRFWRRCTGAGYVFVPVDDPERYTDSKWYRDGSVQERWNQGLSPWQ